MKFKNLFSILLTVYACLLAMPVHAAIGFDTYKATRTYVLAPPENITYANSVVTNGPIDMVKLLGIAKIDLTTITNTGVTGGALTATIYTSPDQTNFTALANYGLITGATPDVITNGIYGGAGLIATNNVLLPGTLTNPTAASAGFATPYLVYNQLTNSGSITLTGKANVQVGFSAEDCQRYIYIVYTGTGTATNFTTSATLTSAAQYQ